jgi:hypothetical protein
MQIVRILWRFIIIISACNVLFFIAIKRTHAKSEIEDIDLSGARFLVLLMRLVCHVFLSPVATHGHLC